MDETCSLCGYEGKYAIKVFGWAVRQRVLKRQRGDSSRCINASLLHLMVDCF
jgi:hypothetical protein